MKISYPGLLLAFALTWGAAYLLAPTQVRPYLVVSAENGVQIHTLQRGVPDTVTCQRQLASLSTTSLAACPTCTVTNSQCLHQLDETQARWLSPAALETPSAVMKQNVIIFESADADTALRNCQTAARLTGNLPHDHRLTCYQPGEPRPLIDDKITRAEAAIPANTLALGILAGIAGLLGLLLINRKQNAQNSQPPWWLEKIALAGTDALILLSAFVVVGSHGHIDARSMVTHLGLTLTVLAWFWVLKEHYARRRPFWDELREIFRVLFIALLLAAAITLHATNDAAAALILWIASFALIPLGRACMKAYMHSLGLWKRSAIIIGTGTNAREAYLAIQKEENLGYRVIAFAAPATQADAPQALEAIKDITLPVIRLEEDLAAQMTSLGCPQIIIGLDTLAPSENQRLIKALSLIQNNVHIIPTIRGLPLFGTQLSHFFSHEVLFLTVRNNLARRGYRWMKRLFDVFVSALLIVLLSPLLLFLTIQIRRSGGAAFYGHQRIGQDGQLFKCLKFRSMRPDADKVLKELLENDPVAKAEWEKDFKLKNDPRITPIGHFIRKTSLDELPQLFNVLKGEMSLVGPRPVVKDELERYGSAAVFYLEAKPGITGLWQVSGRNDTSYAERVSLDSWYVQNWSLWYDIAILFKTFDVVFNRKGAY